MKKIIYFVFFALIHLFLCSCSTKKYISTTNQQSSNVVTTAKKYLGTPYKWGGVTQKGMDCSGLVYTSFLENNTNLPRVSKDQAKIGKTISLQKVAPGDLLFFKTDGSRKINHSAIVTNATSTNVQFIHSTNSRGVIISSINENYWKKAFKQAQRVLKNTPVAAKTKYHKVASGETLYAISKQYSTSVEQLKKINQLQSNTIKVGMVLKIL